MGAFESGNYLKQLRDAQSSGSTLSKMSPEGPIRGLSNLPNSNMVTSSLETDPESSASKKTGVFPYSIASGQRDYQIGQRP